MVARRRSTKNLVVLELSDTLPYTYTRHYAKVVFTRTGTYNANKAACACFPFDYYVEDNGMRWGYITNITGSGTSTMLYDDRSDNPKPVGYKIPGNTPVVFDMPTSSSSIVFRTGKTEMKRPTSSPSLHFLNGNNNNDIYGTFANFSPPVANKYYALTTSGTMSFINTSSVLKPYRWYGYLYTGNGGSN